MSKLVVVTDIGTFKAFRMTDQPVNSRPRLEPIETFQSALGDDRVSRQVSDEAGQFKKNAPSFRAAHAQGTGERHNICLENDRRGVKEIASHLSELLNDNEFDSCYFAASNEINDSVMERLSPQAKAKVEKNVHRDLVNVKGDELLQHFA
jgi:hypothetical protein